MGKVSSVVLCDDEVAGAEVRLRGSESAIVGALPFNFTSYTPMAKDRVLKTMLSTGDSIVPTVGIRCQVNWYVPGAWLAIPRDDPISCIMCDVRLNVRLKVLVRPWVLFR